MKKKVPSRHSILKSYFYPPSFIVRIPQPARKPETGRAHMLQWVLVANVTLSYLHSVPIEAFMHSLARRWKSFIIKIHSIEMIRSPH